MNTQNNTPASRNEEAVTQCPNCKGTRGPHPLDPEGLGRCECAAPGAAIDAREQEAAISGLQPMALKICSMLTDEMARLYPFTSKASHGLAKAEEVRVNVQAVRDVAQELNRKLLASRQEASAANGEPVKYTYASTQATNCAGCGEHKHTPLRIDAMGGYVCLTCINQKLGSLLGEFGYAAPSQALSPATVDRAVIGYTWTQANGKHRSVGAAPHPTNAHNIEPIYYPFAQPCASQGCGGAELRQAAEDAIQWLNSWFRNHDGNKIADKLRAALSTAKSGGADHA